MDLTALLVYCPVDVDGGVLAVVQLVVGIAVAELIQHIVRADAALVLGVLWEARTAEGELVALDPLWEVGLCVPLVLDLVAGVALVVLPADVGAPAVLGLGLLGGAVVGHLEVAVEVEVCTRDLCLDEGVPRLLGVVDVGAPLDLVPLVFVGAAIAVRIVGDHDDAWLTASSLVGFLVVVAEEGVAKDAEVTLAWDVEDRVVEAHDDVATPATEGDEAALVILEVLEGLAVHILLRVTRLIFGEGVGELADSRHILEDAGDVGRRIGIDIGLGEDRLRLRRGGRCRRRGVALTCREGERGDEGERREGALDILRSHYCCGVWCLRGWSS